MNREDRRLFLINAVASTLLLASGGLARADAVSDALGDVAKARAGLKTLVAPFTQERSIGLLATTVKSEGTLTLVLPDRLRWELAPPDAITYWVGPDGFAYETKDGAGATGRSAAGRFGAVLCDLLLFLGGDLERLRARYDLSLVRSAGRLSLTAVPLAAEVKKQVAKVTVVMGADLWSVREVTIEERGGDRSVITFGASRRDVEVDPARMHSSKAR